MKSTAVIRVGGVVLGLAIVVAAASGIVFAQADPHVGTWVLNVEKSKYAPGTALKSQRSVYSAAGKGFEVASATVRSSVSTHIPSSPRARRAAR